MSNSIYFVTHPEVQQDADIPVPKWHLSALGFDRAKKMLRQPWIENIQEIFSSNEQKAIDLANIVSDNLQIKPQTIEELGEIDRSSTGYLGQNEFWKVVKEFFEYPDESVRGWEKATDVQNRIVTTIENIIRQNPNKNIFIASHGGVGVLLNWYIKKMNIPKSGYELGKGGGYYFVFNAKNLDLINDWLPIDKID